MVGSVCSGRRWSDTAGRGYQGVSIFWVEDARAEKKKVEEEEEERKKGERKGKKGQEEWRKESLYLYIYQGKISNAQSK